MTDAAFTADRLVRFWQTDGLRNITPPGVPDPEGFELGSFLRAALAPREGDVVLDYGCGRGRLARFFDPAQYLGVDVNRYAIEAARAANPAHRFETLLFGGAGPASDIVFAYTVLLHVPDELIPDVVLALTSAPVVVVVEILGRHWRRSCGDFPAFNRERMDYEAAFAARAYELHYEVRVPYRHYPGTDISALRFVRSGK